MKVFIFIAVSLFSLFSFASEEGSESKLMRIVCMPMTSGISGPKEYKSEVYVITQSNTDIYSGEFLIDPSPRVNGMTVWTTDDIPFEIEYYNNVQGLNEGSIDAQEISNSLLEVEPDRVMPATGYRSVLPSDGYYYFGWEQTHSLQNFISFDTDVAEATGYNDGEVGGVLECQPPFLVSK